MRLLAAAALVTAVANVLPRPVSPAQAVVHVTSVVLSVLFMGLALPDVPPRSRRPFRLVFGATLIFLAGEFVFTYYRTWQPGVNPNPSDAFLVAGYLPLAVGVYLLDRQRRAAFGGLLDALIVTSSAGVLAMVFLVLPVATADDLSLTAKAVASAYPLVDVLLVFLVARMLIAPGGRGESLWWLIAALSCTLVGDTVNNVLLLGGDTTVPRWLYLLWTLLYVCLGLAVVRAVRDPTSEEPVVRGAAEEAGTDDASSGLAGGRLAVLAVAAMIPSVLLVTLVSFGDRNRTLSLGVGSLVLLSMLMARIWDLLRALNRQADQLAEVARTDPLTGVANRRSWDFEMDRSLAAARQNAGVLLVGLLDLDHFKKYNDTHGHQAGDDLLREAAQAWSLGIGAGGRVARWGGEEFAVALHCTDVGSGLTVLDALRTQVPFGQSCSIGVARWDGTETPAAVLHRADDALYEAKRTGRDRTVFQSSADPVTYTVP
ncbi:hypothetical protein JCM9957A_62050 [Kineosporia succinea]